MRDKYLHGLEVLRSCGFRVVEGSVTRSVCLRVTERLRQLCAAELMELILDPEITAIIATIGGSNSSSLIPHLDFSVIAQHPKIICGYSDVTSLHLAFLKHAGLSTFYGPAVVPSFGEWPTVLPETLDSFLSAVQPSQGSRALRPPEHFSSHFRNGRNNDWKTIPRQFERNSGWNIVRRGKATGPALIANLNTLVTSAGTSYFPDVSDSVLILEEMDARMTRLERSLRHLSLLGVFSQISGLIFSKPESFASEDSSLTFKDLLLEILADTPSYPVVTNFDCGHTHPMLTIAQMTSLSIDAHHDDEPDITINEAMTAV